MTFILLLEQLFNGLQFGVTLFLIAAGLTLILGIMDFVFLAHGAQVMIGAYAAASLTSLTGNFFLGILLAIPITFASGFVLEYVLIRHLYRRDHMDQVLATFGLILFFNELIRIGFGPAALFSDLPDLLSGFVYILPDTPYPMFRLVVIIIGGIGSVRGAFVAAVLVGVVDTMGRVLLPVILRSFMGQAAADGAGPALASMMVYILMSLVLVVRPTGLFPPKG